MGPADQRDEALTMPATPADFVACLGAYLLLSTLVGRTFWLAYLTWKGPRR